MRIDILTVVPELLVSPLNESILKRAQEGGFAEIHIHNIRDYSEDKHHKVDDYPFGGEAGSTPHGRVYSTFPSKRTLSVFRCKSIAA